MCTEVYCDYKWIDENGQKFETEKTPPMIKTKNPEWNYKMTHDLYLSNYIVNNLQESVIMINVYAKMGYEHMSNIIDDFSKRPETAALVASPDRDPNEPFYKEGSGDEGAQMLVIGEENDDDSDLDI